jgi:hypothetical protein
MLSIKSLNEDIVAKRSGYSRCQTCSGQLARRKAPPRPYGSTGTNDYCMNCDRDYNYKVSKSGVRKKVRKEIKKELEQ